MGLISFKIPTGIKINAGKPFGGLYLGLFSEPKKNREELLEMVAELHLPPGSNLRTLSPGLMRCEAPAVSLERGRCVLRGTSAAAIATDFLLSAMSAFAQPLPPQSRQGELILAADRDPCLRVDGG